MSSLPPVLKQIAFFFERLPGIGEKTANRLAFYLLRLPEADLKEFGENITNLKKRTKLCSICFNLTEEDICPICQDNRRDKSIITVVETALDLLSFENGQIYNGVYHVLHGRIDPLNNIGPDDIYINQFFERLRKLLKSDKGSLKEIFLATNLDMEGEATAMYIKNKLEELRKLTGSPSYVPQSGTSEGKKVNGFKITRLAYGLPIGANLEYADYGTLKKAIDGRRDY